MTITTATTLRTARPESVIEGEHYRFTVLTERLIRIEWSDSGAFVDGQTAVVVDREFPPADFTATRSDDGGLVIRTRYLELQYDGREFSSSGLSISLHAAPDIHYSTWRYGEQIPRLYETRGNLGGTARTLDEVDGDCPLEPGILSTYGFEALDDSGSVLIGDDGWPRARPAGGCDLYVFAHGRDYQGALDDYFRLTGAPALVPRYALGNWWSRYWPYSAGEFLELMDGFAAERQPFSVAVLDMDWHLVDVDPAIGTGWTGYTWNPELFPDPAAFLAELHRRGLAVTLNVHPADGIRRHEASYPAVARALGVDPESGDGIVFDIGSREFVEAYLTEVHHPIEEQGVDFWWLDWQSGGVSRIDGLDPLWMLNHVHVTDLQESGKRAVTLSRYAGPGSHRYPVGFSGDTHATWASLDFQPYFTSTAANIGYFWWSHDIGGHMRGRTDPELTLRWMQFGVLSPVNRLHSSASPFGSKEPNLLGTELGGIAARYLRLRHALVPYLYTAAHRAHADGVPVVRPMYHAHPYTDEAYLHRNVYLLGPDLLVAPITTPVDGEAQVAATAVWLPEGEWTDLFSGRRYRGGRTTTVHRGLDEYPVLVRAGAVLPLAMDAMAPVDENPARLALRVFEGTSTSTIVEDDGSARPRPWTTEATQTTTRRDDGGSDIRLVLASEADVPARRLEALAFDLVGIASIEGAVLFVDGVERPITQVEHATDDAADLSAALRLEAHGVDLHAAVELRVTGARRRVRSASRDAFGLLQRARIDLDLKDRALATIERAQGIALADELAGIGLPPVLLGALLEVFATAEA
ncbi:TIM-barrel domain-containing protein [Agromyces sp. NPDC058110]|uniref:TIM-barrel domain-containing protein n=1 Tax=Agromyces sp. NPDC058110 TaxID=3346345 RepID=UPI0036D9D168